MICRRSSVGSVRRVGCGMLGDMFCEVVGWPHALGEQLFGY